MSKIKLNYHILNDTLDRTSNPNPWIVGHHMHHFCRGIREDWRHQDLLSVKQLWLQYLINLRNHGCLVDHRNNITTISFSLFNWITSQITIKHCHDHIVIFDDGNTIINLQIKYLVPHRIMQMMMSKAITDTSKFHDIYYDKNTFQLYSNINTVSLILYAVNSFLDLYTDINTIAKYFRIQMDAIN